MCAKLEEESHHEMELRKKLDKLQFIASVIYRLDLHC